MKRYITGIIFFVMTVVAGYSQDVVAMGREIMGADTDCPESAPAPALYASADYGASSPATVAHRSFDYKKTAEWGKYKVLRAVGWTAFGVGLPVTLGGMVMAAISGLEGYNISGPAIGIIAAGGVLTLSSVPILITAYHYRGKAKKMTLDVGVSPLVAPNPIRRADFNPGLSFALRF